MVLVVKLGEKYLKSIDGFQAMEWTRDVRSAIKFNGQGASYANQIADTYGAQVLRYDPSTGQITAY